MCISVSVLSVWGSIQYWPGLESLLIIASNKHYQITLVNRLRALFSNCWAAQIRMPNIIIKKIHQIRRQQRWQRQRRQQQQCRFSFVLFISFVARVQLSNLFFLPSIHSHGCSPILRQQWPTDKHIYARILSPMTTVRLRFTLPFAIFERNSSSSLCSGSLGAPHARL